MSHFSVLVIGDKFEDQLAPFHEFECTGNDNVYVKDIDITKSCRKEYMAQKETMYKDQEGKLHEPYQSKFYREPSEVEQKEIGMGGCGGNGKITWDSRDWGDGKGYRTKIHFLPIGWKEVEVKTNKIKTFVKWLESYHGKKVVLYGQKPDLLKEHKYGYVMVDKKGKVTKVIDRTNPNAHWDWYEVGGRWNGYFKLKPNAHGIVGKPGLQIVNKDYKHPGTDRADVCLKKDIDFDSMRNDAGEKAANDYDLVAQIIANHPPIILWENIRKKYSDTQIEKARKEYWNQPAILALRANEQTQWFEINNFVGITKDKYILENRNSAISTFAIVKDGKWYERGEMGWWGVVRDEKNKEKWSEEFTKLIDDLPEDTLLTVVDCHI